MPFTAGQCNQWTRVKVGLPAAANNRADVRLAFRWRNEVTFTGGTQYSGDGTRQAAYNVDNVQVEVMPDPVADFKPGITNPCKGESFFLVNTSQTNGLALTYSWVFSPSSPTFLGGTTASSASPQIRFDNTGTYSVTLTATTPCGNTFTVVKNNLFNIGPCVPTPSFFTNLSDVCSTTPAPVPGALTQVVFTNNSTSSSPITGYSWNFGAGASPATGTGAGPFTVTWSTAGAKTVSLTVTNADGPATISKTINVVDCQCTSAGGGTGGTVELYKETFGSGLNGWTGATTGSNRWVVNSVYSGGFICFPSGMTQPGGITNAGTNYLHITSGTALFDGSGPCFSAGSGGGGNITSPAISLAGKTNITLTLWVRKGSGAMSVQVSTNGTAGPFNTLQNISNGTPWTQLTFTDPAWDNAADFRVRVRWTEAGSTDPAGAVDDVIVTSQTGGGGGTPGIFTCPISGPICAGSTVTVPFNAIGTFNAGNEFRAQLSNASGSFATPTQIGTLTGATAVGTDLQGRNITATIPLATPAGTGYRIRVVSTNPVEPNMTDNGANIEIRTAPVQQTITGKNQVCTNTLAEPYSVPSQVAANAYTWSIVPPAMGTITNGQGTKAIVINWGATAGAATVRLVETNGCGSVTTDYAVAVAGGLPTTSAIAGPSLLCTAGGPATGTYSVTSTTGSTYTWVATGGTITAGQGTASVTVDWGTTQGPRTLSVTEANSCGSGAPKSMGINVWAGPPAGIKTQGPMLLTVTEATTQVHTYQVPFQSGVSYTWSIIPAAAGNIFTGQGTNVVTIDWANAVATPTLRVVASTGATCSPITFDTLVYIINPTTIQNVDVPTTACVGSTVVLNFRTTGGTFAAGNIFSAEVSASKTSWSNNIVATLPLAGANLAPPATNMSITIGAPTFVAGTKYYFRVKSSNPPLTSVDPGSIDSIVVVQPPTSFTLTVNSSIVCAGSTVAFTLQSSELGVDYYLETGGSQVGATVPGTGSALTFSNVGPIATNTTYRVVGVRSPCTATPVSNNVTVSVDANPQTGYTLSTTTPTVCLGDPVALTLSGSELGTTYQLLRNGTPEGTAVPGTGSALTFAAASLTADATYSIQATRGVCPPATFGSVAVDLLVAVAPQNFALSASSTGICQGTTTTLSLSGSQVAFDYQLEDATTSAVIETLPGTGSALSFAPLTLSAPGRSFHVRAVAAPCTDDVISNVINVTVEAAPQLYTLQAAQDEYCYLGDVELTLSGSETGRTYQLLQDGTPVGSAVPGTGGILTFVRTGVATTTTYGVRVLSSICPSQDMGPVVVTVHPLASVPTPGFEFSSNPELVGVPVTFVESITGGVPATVTYTLNGTTITSPYVFATRGTYTVRQTVSSADGCERYVDKVIRIREEQSLLLYNVFTPNGDGHNDTYDIMPQGFTDLQFQVYDRRGNMVYETKEMTVRWDGRNSGGQSLPEGTYMYVLKITTADGEKLTRTGNISLLR